jgi:hypothetical protein
MGAVLAPPLRAPLPRERFLKLNADHRPDEQDGEQQDGLIDQRNEFWRHAPMFEQQWLSVNCGTG